ncbi:MAG: Asp-tRNA(Asn)/Glu-tRNA(Gln) amidotransferase subunit GatC [Proteobacteria bacterium]|nr:Asp-tRNA(Asn)/Glu-tRNA(Gln) amidotransferase subunit GatC [Pseudomonadota bacterium]
MAKLTEKDIKKVARLARIEISSDSCQQLTNQVGSIISWVEKLAEINTDNVAALTNVHEMALRADEDKIKDGNKAEEVLKNSSNAKYGYFTVPKVIE